MGFCAKSFSVEKVEKDFPLVELLQFWLSS